MRALEQCGVSDGVVSQFRSRGLRISPSIRPVESPIRSLAPDWWVYSVDDFTPALTDQELQEFTDIPSKLGEVLLANLRLFSDLCDHLIPASSLLGSIAEPQERLGATLAMLHLFQSAMDNHYYKYDRHFDYQDSQRSPVGLHWARILSHSRTIAASNAPDDCETEARRIALRCLSAFEEQQPESTIYIQICKKLGDKLGTTPSLSELRDISQLEIAVAAIPQLDQEVAGIAGRFHQSVAEVLTMARDESMSIGNSRLGSPLSQGISESIINDYADLLSAEAMADLGNSINAMRSYQIAQEQEPFIFYGLTSSGEGRILDVGFACWQSLNEFRQSTPDLIAGHATDDFANLLSGNPIFGTRKVLHLVDYYVAASPLRMYKEEILRWYD